MQAIYSPLLTQRNILTYMPLHAIYRYTLTSLNLLLLTVPFGKHAFFPGELRHTNELQVHLGGQYRAECTASHALGILQRRKTVIEKDIADVKAEAKVLEERLSLTTTELRPLAAASAAASEGMGGADVGEGKYFEIREPYEESEAMLQSTSLSQKPITKQENYRDPGCSSSTHGVSSKSDADLDRIFARMDELELLEMQEEQDQLQRVASGPAGAAEGSQVIENRLPSESSLDDIQDMFVPVPLHDLDLDNVVLPNPTSGLKPQASRPSAEQRLRPLLKKGFFGGGPAAKPKVSSNSSSAASVVPEEKFTASGTDEGPSGSHQQEAPAGSTNCKGAFSGRVVERGGSKASGEAKWLKEGVSTINDHGDVERMGTEHAAPMSNAPEAEKKVSRFKLQRVGR